MLVSLDLHAHSVCSDGTVSPRDFVLAAKSKAPSITALALTDHNTFSGCRDFLDACAENGIEGFVAAEISGSHPRAPQVEFHFIAVFGNALSDPVRSRTAEFIPYFNRLVAVDTQNIFTFLDCAAKMSVRIGFSEIVAACFSSMRSCDHPLSDVKAPAFRDVRTVLKNKGLAETGKKGKTSFEAEVWENAHVRPLPTPSITAAYDIFRSARPAVILAHPMLYPFSMEELTPFIDEWKREIDLAGMETHYAGRSWDDWHGFASANGLLASVGTDTHNAYEGIDFLPEVDAGGYAVEKLLDTLRRQGTP
ncbi:MAG: PHP domain-containing protein [Planctomycetes bacterium]|nr:PHP domain-containing protein [Planctomycetota bacterium]